VSVTGTTLTIYASVPAQNGTAQGQDILNAEQLALQQAGSQVGSFKVKFVPLTGGKLSDNARTAIEDKSTVAYLGENVPGASADSIGITNAQDVLQVSPGDTALELTQATAAVPGAPNRYYESLSTYGRTFARVVPSAAVEAKAQVQEMQSLHVTKLYVTDDGSHYGNAIALAVKQDAAPAITVAQGAATVAGFQASGADALFFGGSSAALAEPLFGSVAKARTGAKLFAPSALDDGAFASSFGAANLSLYVSAPGLLSSDLPPLAQQKFIAPFEAAYHHPPQLEAIFGYEAMAAVLAVIRQAGSAANDRSTVVHDFFQIKNRSSVLGTYSINGNGDTSLGAFVFSRFKAGRLIPFKVVQAQG
jgi:branched-chain amino acid transport system substrate-binding protein